ncbi:hypothetical protein Tco_0389474 [Tanacetum coccineum]
MKRSIVDVSNALGSNSTPREQRHHRRDKVREEAKKREREEEVDSIKGRVESKLSNKRLKASIQMAAIALRSQQRVIGVAEIGSGKAAFISRKPKMRVMMPIK